jgi:predicted RNA-binding protein with PUA-like domain
MAFSISGLTRIGGGVGGASGAPQIWTYRTNDTRAVVDNAGYFDNGATTNTGMRQHMKVGDVVFLFCTADTIPTFGMVFVNQVTAAGVIDVTNATDLVVSDTD